MSETHEQLGDFLRSRRERLKPAQVGLSDTRRRRTPGLRREEVATLAGISAEWYLKLEQGRAVNPSSTTVDALARALQLNEGGHAHLRALAGVGNRPALVAEEVPTALRRLIESLTHPAYVTGLRWDLLAWNAATDVLFADLAKQPDRDRNILLYMLVNPNARVIFGNHWEDEARRMVSLFRATFDLEGENTGFCNLVERVRSGCPEFGGWWDSHDVAKPVSGIKQLRHPDCGLRQFAYTTLQLNDDPRLRLTVYIPS